MNCLLELLKKSQFQMKKLCKAVLMKKEQEKRGMIVSDLKVKEMSWGRRATKE